MKKSLLIDINYKNSRFETRSEIAIVSIAKILTEKFLYTDHYFLTEEGKGEKPTKLNIIKYINRLIEESPNCDEIWIHYMGHSTKVIDSKNDDVPRGLMPVDYKENGYIPHEELKELFDKIQCNLYLIIDCCYGNHGYNTGYSLKMINGKFISEMNDIVHIPRARPAFVPDLLQIEEKKEKEEEEEGTQVAIIEEKKEKFYGRRIISLYMGTSDDKKKKNETKRDIANLFSRRFVEILEDYGYNLNLDLFITMMCMKFVEEKFLLQTLLFSSNVPTRGKTMIFENYGTPKKLQIEYRIPDEVKRELSQLRAQKEQKKTDDLKQMGSMFKTNVVDPATIKIGNKEETNFSQYKKNNTGNDFPKIKEIKQSALGKKQKRNDLVIEPAKAQPIIKKEVINSELAKSKRVVLIEVVDDADDFLRNEQIVPKEMFTIEPSKLQHVLRIEEERKSVKSEPQQEINKVTIKPNVGYDDLQSNSSTLRRGPDNEDGNMERMKKQVKKPMKIPITNEIYDVKKPMKIPIIDEIHDVKKPMKIPIIDEIHDERNKQNFQPIKTRENKRMLLDPVTIMRKSIDERSELSIPVRKPMSIPIDGPTIRPIDPPKRSQEFSHISSIQDDNRSVAFTDTFSVTSFQSKKMSRIMSLKDIKNARKNAEKLSI